MKFSVLVLFGLAALGLTNAKEFTQHEGFAGGPANGSPASNPNIGNSYAGNNYPITGGSSSTWAPNQSGPNSQRLNPNLHPGSGSGRRRRRRNRRRRRAARFSNIRHDDISE
jgi:hypothetical protein